MANIKSNINTSDSFINKTNVQPCTNVTHSGLEPEQESDGGDVLTSDILQSRFNNIVPKPPVLNKKAIKKPKNYDCGNGFFTKIIRNKAKGTTKKTTYFNRTDFTGNKKPPTKVEAEEFIFTKKNKSKISDLCAIAKQEYNLLNTITLTLRSKYSTDFNINCDVFRNTLLKSFIQSLCRELGIKQSEFFYLWKLELTEKNIPHIHFICGIEIEKSKINNLWNKVVRNYLSRNNHISAKEKKVWKKEMYNFNNQISTKGSKFLLYPNITDYTKKSNGIYFHKKVNLTTGKFETKKLNTNDPKAVSRYISKDIEVNLEYIENEIQLLDFIGKLFDCSNYANKLYEENLAESKELTSKEELRYIDTFFRNKIVEQQYEEYEIYDYSSNEMTKFNVWKNEELETIGIWCSNYSLLEFFIEYTDIEQPKVQRLLEANKLAYKGKAEETKKLIKQNIKDRKKIKIGTFIDTTGLIYVINPMDGNRCSKYNSLASYKRYDIPDTLLFSEIPKGAKAIEVDTLKT